MADETHSQEAQEQTPQTEAVVDAASKTGIVDDTGDEGVEHSDVGVEPVPMPSYFIEPEDRHRVVMDVLLDPKTGRIRRVQRAVEEIDPEKFPNTAFRREWLEFSLPAHKDMAIYRQRCLVYNQQAQRMLTNIVQFRSYIVVYHLKDWSLCDRNGNKVELAFSDDGSLDKETIAIVENVNTRILDVALTIFEKDALLM